MSSSSGEAQGPLPEAIHPPWQAGQYLTYFMERDDGSWVACCQRALGQLQNGAWALQADLKTAVGEHAVYFRCDPPDAPNGMDAPVRFQTLRELAAASPSDPNSPPAGWLDRPDTLATLFMNVVLVRRSAAAREALRGEAGPSRTRAASTASARSSRRAWGIRSTTTSTRACC
jgi:hypothetical protein